MAGLHHLLTNLLTNRSQRFQALKPTLKVFFEPHIEQLRDITDRQDDVRLGIATFTVPIATDILTYTFTVIITDADGNIGNAVSDELSSLCCVLDNITGLI